MGAALIATFLAIAFTQATAQQLSVVGEGLMSNPVTSNAPGKPGMRYAGPIVYTNEKPPIIYFPPPPKDAKPGFYPNPIFGKGKSPKSIKYVPMPHHDLPVLIYTSDKTPPIHVVQPPAGEQFFQTVKDDFGPPSAQLSSAYQPEATSARVVTSSYEIPGTSYGSPVKAYQREQSIPPSPSSFGPSAAPFSETIVNRPFNQKKPPTLVFSGHPPVHVFNEPDMYVKAPREVPFKNYQELPPKASFGPPKSSFGPPVGSTFIPSQPRPYRPRPPFTPSRPYIGDNLVLSSSNTPSIQPSPSPSSISFGDSSSQSSPAGSSSSSQLSYSPSQTTFSFGPLSIEYGPPSEPFMSFSEPTGSLSSFYSENSAKPTDSANGDWIPGPPPADIMEQKENEFAHQPPPFRPQPVHFPSSHLHHPAPFGGSKLAHLFSNFKLKRNKPKYAIAPKTMHKPPIIIYYGQKPPIHVYQKGQEVQVTEASAPQPITISEAPRNVQQNDNDLSYSGSVKSEVRISAPQPTPSKITYAERSKPAIIQAKPVDIFTQTELQPSIYMARNSLNTIFVSDLSGSGAKAIKTFVVRRTEGDNHQGKLNVAEATVFPPMAHRISEEAEIIPATTHVDIEELQEESREVPTYEPKTTILVVPSEKKVEVEEEPIQESRHVQVIHSPSSFQSLSQAEKEAEQAQNKTE